MNEDVNTPYESMYQAPVAPAPERVFGATAMVDDSELIYDETNSMWVYAANRDEPWVGVDPVIEPTVASEVTPEPEPVPDSPETFVSVNLDGAGGLRLRGADSLDGAVLATIPNETALKVINADNPEWPFVEYANGDNEPLRGYVKGSLVVEIPAQ